MSPSTRRRATADLVVVANRLPVDRVVGDDGETTWRPSPGGLVSALEPITRACAGTWIAYGGGSADALVVDKNDRIEVPPDNPSYTLRRVWLS